MTNAEKVLRLYERTTYGFLEHGYQMVDGDLMSRVLWVKPEDVEDMDWYIGWIEDTLNEDLLFAKLGLSKEEIDRVKHE